MKSKTKPKAKAGAKTKPRSRPAWAKAKPAEAEEVPVSVSKSHEPKAGAKDSPPKKTGGAKSRTEAINSWQKAQRKKEQDIGPIPTDGINWERRLSTQFDLRLFAETYLPAVFYYGWSEDQLRCVKKAQSVFLDSGMFALAMPRGGGKTAICRAGMIWATANGHRRFPFFIGSTQDASIQTLQLIKTYWYMSDNLRQDFPEIGWPVYKVENRWHLARTQLHLEQPTHIEWGSETVRYPSLVLTEEEAGPYLRNLPGFLLPVPPVEGRDYVGFLPKNAGAILKTSGIDGSIRGVAEVHPLTLEQVRPDCVLLDDIQKDQKADSPASCEKLIRLVDGAVQGLAGPGKQIAALMPCTVIREGDASDIYLDRVKKPEWRGERCKMVISWPEGIDDYTISPDTEAGRLWLEYAELRKRSLRLYENIQLATDLYAANRDVMDAGFVCSWADRYTKEGGDVELSAMQHAMNLRLKSPLTFPAEYQNLGRRPKEADTVMITVAQLSEKTIPGLPEYHVPPDTQWVTAMIDIQDEILFYSCFASAPDFTGIIPTYGTWPDLDGRTFFKAQTSAWGLLSKEFFKAYPQHRDKAIHTEGGLVRAPLEAKIYYALGCAVRHILGLQFTKADGFATPLHVARIAIDTRWGQTSDVVKRFCRECGIKEVVPYYGQAVSPAHKQFEEYTRTKGWLFEDGVNPQVKDVKWIYRPDNAGQYHLAVDVDRMKTFLMARLASPPGSQGGISLYEAPPERHELFASHLLNSEYPEPISARGITKDKWQAREGRPDNDWLDTTVGAITLASTLGAFLRTDAGRGTVKPATTRKLSDLWQAKRNKG